MTEELNRKADRLSLAYKTKYSEDRTLKDMLSRPQAFVEGAIEGIVNLLRQKAYRDGYIAGTIENSIQWHDLRKNPNDLPDDEREVLQQGVVWVMYINGHWRYVHGGKWEDDAHVYAWIDIPVFLEGEE